MTCKQYASAGVRILLQFFGLLCFHEAKVQHMHAMHADYGRVAPRQE